MNYLKEEPYDPYDKEVKLSGGELALMLKKGVVKEFFHVNSRPTVNFVLEYMTAYGESFAFLEDNSSITTIVGSIKKLNKAATIEWFKLVNEMKPDELKICSMSQTYKLWWN